MTLLYPPLLPPLRVTQWFGENPDRYARFGIDGHPAIDLACNVGTEVYAMTTGIVSVGQGRDSGIICRIHSTRGTVVYRHLSVVLRESSHIVMPTQVVALSGNTGEHTTGPHLDVSWYPVDEPYDNGYHGAVDPWPLIQEGIMELEKAGRLATDGRWFTEEEVARRWERIQQLKREIAIRQEQIVREESALGSAIRVLVNPREGKLYAIEAALGLPVPPEWRGGKDDV